MSQTCPKCRLYNPDNAERCDCGYDFKSGDQKSSYLTAHQVQKAGSHLAAVKSSSRSKIVTGTTLLVLGLGVSIMNVIVDRRLGIALLPTILGVVWIVRGITERNTAREADAKRQMGGS